MSHWKYFPFILLSWFAPGFLSPVAGTASPLPDNDDLIHDSNYSLMISDPDHHADVVGASHLVDDAEVKRLTMTVDTEFKRLRDFEFHNDPFNDNQLLEWDAHSMLEKDYSIKIDDHIMDEYGNIDRTPTIGQQQVDNRMTTSSTDVNYKKSMINHQTDAYLTPDHLRHHVLSHNNQQRKAQSCVRSASGLKQAFQKSAMKGYNPTIGVCVSRIGVGSLKTSQSRYLQSSSYNTTNLTFIGLDGGIDASNRSIVLTCLLKQRCILDGEGISRILYGTNTRLTIVGFQFLNASSFIGSALHFIGNSQIILQDCSFNYNNAEYGGGAILMSDSKLIFKDSHRRIEFSNNGANYGGAIFGLNATIQTNITSLASPSGIINFQDNYANQDGGAVHVTKSTVKLKRVILEKNDAANGGAAMFNDTNVTMTNMYVKGNSASLTGGAFVFLNATVLINNSTFDSNNGNGTVEAMTVKSSNVQVTDSTFRRSLWYVKSSTLNLTNSCLPQGSTCEVGASCNNCCKPYSYWISRADNFCGLEPPIKKCFGNDDNELRNALIDYLSGNATVKRNLTKVYGQISIWCTGAVTDWSYMFANWDFNEDISRWDTSNATTMSGAFYFNTAFNKDISNWNMSKVEDMSGMFRRAYEFNKDISKWNTSQVTDISDMFLSAYSFNQDISRWDVSKVITMNGMFQDATNFNGNISKWNVSQVIDMSYMFNSASSFNQDVDQWDVSKVNRMNSMFSDATSFNGNISNWNVSQVTTMSTMFYGASSFNQDISKWDVANVDDMYAMFDGATAFNGNISNWDVSQVTDMAYMFNSASSFNQDIDKWDVSKVYGYGMDHMFYYATTFNGNISKWNVSQVTDMSEMFNGASSFNQDISKWDVSKVNRMNSMFYGASSFNQDISKWDVSNVNGMYSMFHGATSFNGNISKWNVSRVTGMSYMFAGATSFNHNITGWNVSRVSDMGSMFYGASSFNQNLCAWKDKCKLSFYSYRAFSGTPCPNKTDPVCGSGPFCYTC